MDREDLLRRIREVFPDPVWPQRKLAAIENSASLGCRYIVDHYQGKQWTELTREELGWSSQDANEFSEEALVFFFPAWLASDVGDPDHAHQIEVLSGFLPQTFIESFSAEQRMLAYESLIYVYGGENPSDDSEYPLHRLLCTLSSSVFG